MDGAAILMLNFCLSVAAQTIVYADPPVRYTLSVIAALSNQPTKHPWLESEAWYGDLKGRGQGVEKGEGVWRRGVWRRGQRSLDTRDGSP